MFGSLYDCSSVNSPTSKPSTPEERSAYLIVGAIVQLTAAIEGLTIMVEKLGKPPFVVNPPMTSATAKEDK